MKVTQVITGALVLGSVALGTVGLAPEAAAINLVNPNNGDTFNAPDPDKQVLRFWEAEEAVSDSYLNVNHRHSVWLPELQTGGTFVFDGPAFLYEYTDGTANLTGSIYAPADSNKKFNVDVWFKPTDPTNPPSPKKELDGSAYSPSGPVNTNDWWYYEIDDSKSTLTGFGANNPYSGWTLDLKEYSNTYSAQFGVGANGKNINMGLAAWFGYEGTRSDGSDFSNEGHSDFNLDLIPLQLETSPNNDPVDIPEPATMSLLSLGLLGFGMGALKRKKA